MSDKREAIVKEFLRRLKSVNPGYKAIYEGDGGIWGNWGHLTPAAHVYELPTEERIATRGMYEIRLPIQVLIIVKLSDKSKLYTVGRRKLLALSTGIEQDERFKSFDTNKELVVTYWRSNTELTDILDGVIGIGAIYQFVYAEKAKGYEQGRPMHPSNTL